jgi:hypothetical protein
MNLRVVLLLLACPSGLGKRGLRKTRSLTHRQHIPMESRIIGGSEAPAGQYPFFVQWIGCGASLIHDDIILTAAHCDPITDDYVVIGSHLSFNDTAEGTYSRSITSRSRHPSYDDSTLENDFLIMKLDSAVPITPVALNSDSSNPRPQELLTVIGFGLEEENGWAGSDSLMEVNVKAYSHGQCNARYNGEIIEDAMFCAGVPEGGKDSCQGDSGGPIIDGFGAQVGVVSWGYGCGQAEYPGVYARVSGAIDWINQQICDLSDNKPASCGLPSPTDPPTQPPQGSIPVQISITLDDYPEEVGLELSRGSNIVYDKAAGDFLGMESFTETLNLLPGNYKMQLTDTYGDGLCCLHGEGRYEIDALLPNGNEISLAAGDGQYGESLLIEFSVPQDRDEPVNTPTSSPTASTTASKGEDANDFDDYDSNDDALSENECEDSSARFLIDSVVGYENCEFLSENLDRYSYLCQFLEVAHHCPNTCDACGFF